VKVALRAVASPDMVSIWWVKPSENTLSVVFVVTLASAEV
jgi:hypothetical protein